MTANSPLQGRIFDRARRLEQLGADAREQVANFRGFLLAPETRTEFLGAPTDATVDGARLVVAATAMLATTADGTPDPAAAKRLAEGLVLAGVVAPKKETLALQGFGFDGESYVLVDPALSGSETQSVWAFQDGAIQAGELKRKKGGMLSKFTGSTTKVYVVANDKRKIIGVFDSDIAQRPLATLDLSSSATVEFDNALPHGVKVSNAVASEVFGTPSKEQQDEWLNSFINAGAIYREAFNLSAESVQSFYDLQDFDMQGNAIPMSKYKGKVVLVVNVSSKCGLTPTNYPELAALDERYRDQGLEILAFPCNQFSSQEPGTHEEIMEFVKRYNCKFQFFEKHDVNGANARPVFTYLKAKLPGSFGNFVKWNFTKFLVDREGKPYKRYAPKELPFSFEDDIKALLEKST